MKVLISFLFIFLMSYFYVSAQSTLFSPKDTIRIHLTIGKSSDNTFTKEKEAEVVGTFPDSDTLKSSWLSNAYLEFGLTSDSSGWSFGFIGELHKNTLVEKEQDVRQYGLSFGKIFTTSKQNLITSEIPTSLTIKYSENKIKETNIFQIIGGLSYNRFRGPAFLKTQTAFPRYKSTFGKLLRFSHSHNLGFAYLVSCQVKIDG